MASHFISTYCGSSFALRWPELDRGLDTAKTARYGGRPPLSAVSPAVCCQKKRDHFAADPNLKTLKLARDKFAQEISSSSDDQDISLPKALLLIAVEDEAFIAFNREKDALSFINERKDVSLPVIAQSEVNNVENILLSGKSMSEWLNELDMVAKEVESELISRDIGCHLVEVLEAVNIVLFKIKGFRRFPVSVDLKFSYLHTALNTGYGSDILISIICIEICRKLGITIMGSKVGENFLIWPKTNNPQELFRAFSGHSLFATINGKCMENPKTMAFEMDSTSLLGLDATSNRDIISIALANLIRLYWKRSSSANRGLMPTSPLGPIHPKIGKPGMPENLQVPLLRPQDLRISLKFDFFKKIFWNHPQATLHPAGHAGLWSWIHRFADDAFHGDQEDIRLRAHRKQCLRGRILSPCSDRLPADSKTTKNAMDILLPQPFELFIKEQLEADMVIVKDAYGDGRHVSISVVSKAFDGKSAVNRQRMVYKAIWEELQSTVHAVDEMITKTPEEAAAEK